MKFSVSDAMMSEFMTYPDEFACIKNAGYDGIDFMLDRYNKKSEYRTESEKDVVKYFTEIKALADEEGLKIYQTHAPFPTFADKKDKEAMTASLRNSIIATSVLGAKFVVIHPIMPKHWKLRFFMKKRFDENIKFYKALEPIAERYGVKIMLEDMFSSTYLLPRRIDKTVLSTTDEAKRMLDVLGRKNFGFCLDIGHYNLLRCDPAEAIHEMKGYVDCLHIHDNNGLSDQHLAEKEGNMDWNEICKALKDIGYKGIYNSEANTSVVAGGKERIPDNLKRMYLISRSLPYAETEE